MKLLLTVAHPDDEAVGCGSVLARPLDLTTTVVDVSRRRELREQAIRAHASQVPPFDSMSPDPPDWAPRD